MESRRRGSLCCQGGPAYSLSRARYHENRRSETITCAGGSHEPRSRDGGDNDKIAVRMRSSTTVYCSFSPAKWSENEATEAMQVTEEESLMMVGNCFDFPWKSEVKMDPDISLASTSIRSRCFSLQKRRSCLSPPWQRKFIEKRVKRRE